MPHEQFTSAPATSEPPSSFVPHQHSQLSMTQPSGTVHGGLAPVQGGPNPYSPIAYSFNTPTAQPTMSIPGRQYMKVGLIHFQYNNMQYELQETDFIKYAGDLLEVRNLHNIIHFYKHLQNMAIQQNIFVTDFEQLTY